MDMEEETYQEVVYILREDGTVEEKFTLPERSVESAESNNYNHDETVVTVTELIATPHLTNPKSTTNNFNNMTLVNSRGEEFSNQSMGMSLSTSTGSNVETQIFHLNGLEQYGLTNNLSASNINETIQVPQQLMELDDSVMNSDNINIFEVDEDNDDIQLFASPESPNKFIISSPTINMLNLNSKTKVYEVNDRDTKRYTFGSPVPVPRTYNKNVTLKPRPIIKGQGVSQLLLAHEVSKVDSSIPLIITNARSLTPKDIEWLNHTDGDEFIIEKESEIAPYGATEEVGTSSDRVDLLPGQDPSLPPPLIALVQVPSEILKAINENSTEIFCLPDEIKQEPNEGFEEKLLDQVVKEEPDSQLDETSSPIDTKPELKRKKAKSKKRSKWVWNALDTNDELLKNLNKRPDKSKKWMCAICYKWHNEKSDLELHFRESHFKSSKFQKCRFCHKKFLARFLCLRHEKIHEKELKFPLSFYNRPHGPQEPSFFDTLRKPAPFSKVYQAHFMHMLQKLKNQLYECTDCDQKFSDEENAMDHYETCHAIQECIFCNEFFDNLTKLEAHLSEVHEFCYLKSFPSDYWSLQEVISLEMKGERDDTIASRVEFFHSYAKKPDLEPPERRNYFNYLKRMQSVESTETPAKTTRRSNSKFKFLRKKAMTPTPAPPTSSEAVSEDSTKILPALSTDSAFKCKICGASFPSDAEFSEHIKSKHSYEVKPKPFPCNFCDKKFATHSNRKEHERIHTNEKNYVCPFCNKGFVQISNLKKHITTHKDQNLKCNTCEKQFVTKNSLVLHQRAHAADRKFRCNLCDRAYNYASLLKRHMRIHTGECPYECDICFQPFHELVSLHYHRKKIHTGERPHKCTTCGKAFILSSDLKKHLSVHNKAESSTSTIVSKTGRLKRSRKYADQNLVEVKIENKEEEVMDSGLTKDEPVENSLDTTETDAVNPLPEETETIVMTKIVAASSENV